LVIGQLGFGGAERQVSLMARGLAGAGWPVSVICLSELIEPFGAEIEQAGIGLHWIKRRGRYDPERLVKLARLLRENSIELIHSHLETASIYSYLALALAGRPKFIPAVLSMPADQVPVREWILARALEAGDAIHVNSHAAIRAYSERYRVSESKFRIVHNGAFPLPSITEKTRQAARNKFDIPQNALVVGTLSKDAPDKNLPAFFRLVGALKAGHEKLVALAAGQGLDHSCAEKITGAGASGENIILLGPRKDVETVFATMDIFVLTSLREGLPNVVMEAMASGLPVAAFDTGGVSELIEQQVSGVVLSSGDEQGLLREVDSLLADPERRRKMGEAARDRMFTRFSVEKMIERTAALYEEVLRKAKTV
jgi:glycosyltransferase involved in cell wall biosynthesis